MKQTNNTQPKFNHDKVGHCQDYNTLFKIFRDTTNWVGAMMEMISGSEIEDLNPIDIDFIMNVTTQFYVIDSVISDDLEEARGVAYRIIQEIKEKLENGEKVHSPLVDDIEEWESKLGVVTSDEEFSESIFVDYTVDGLATYKLIEKTSYEFERVVVDQLRL